MKNSGHYKMRKVKKRWVTVSVIPAMLFLSLGLATVKADAETSDSMPSSTVSREQTTDQRQEPSAAASETNKIALEGDSVSPKVGSEQTDPANEKISEQNKAGISEETQRKSSVSDQAAATNEPVSKDVISETAEVKAAQKAAAPKTDGVIVTKNEAEQTAASDQELNQAKVQEAIDSLTAASKGKTVSKDQNSQKVQTVSELQKVNGLTSTGISTLDAAALTYEFERARINGATDANILSEAQKGGKIIPSNLQYIADFYDNNTGTSGTAFKDTNINKVVIAYTGTNSDGNEWKDAVGADIMGIGLARGQHYQPAYDFYDKMALEYGAANIILTGHSLGGNVAQRVALKRNVPNTIVYNAAPLYIPIIASVGNAVYESIRNRFQLPPNKEEAKKTISEIENERKNFTGKVTRITTQKDSLNNIVRRLGGVYIGKEYVINNSGGHDLKFIASDPKQIDNIKNIITL
ncbi:KxYKxGKxW signal peptide domain-containing protein [Streptococcus macacae]|uniref:KxYKxGKxW signal domain protein n=1 Tax=Streptococcus macacae NCTC 11558 TaxID=764298 RepID=G5JXZ7_9STRE|nr:KxYKxGKxW signal peptide domain-containing protein [Streptococcus macacae]EHJ52144.1 KxYKxGKxW signal domain protein [Streptococcus macacae NCTC 11558]SUN77915.1 lipase [Streptococcus macacae NCTC 11558]